MREVDGTRRDVCAFQGRVFERSATQLPECGSAVFVRRFMRSDTAWRVDENGSFDAGSSEDSVVCEVDEAYGRRPYGSDHYPSEALYWMGYLYRYWCFSTDMSSKQVYAACGAREMLGLYLAYHTLDPQQSVERILESKGMTACIMPDSDMERRAIKLLRQIRGRHSE